MSALLQQNAFSTRLGGAPAGPVRQSLIEALRAGAVGSYECLAQHAGVEASKARYTLQNLRREGLAVVRESEPLHAGRGRPRTVFARAPEGGAEVFDALAFLNSAWR